MKKIALLLLSVFIGLGIFATSASAATPITFQGVDLSTQTGIGNGNSYIAFEKNGVVHIVVDYGANSGWTLLNPTASVAEGGYYNVSVGTQDFYYERFVAGEWQRLSKSDIQFPIKLSDSEPFYSNRNIAINGTEDFFFSVPSAWELRSLQSVKTIPTTLKEALVDGGILSVGLLILAVLLGVSLVRRLPFSFLR